MGMRCRGIRLAIGLSLFATACGRREEEPATPPGAPTEAKPVKPDAKAPKPTTSPAELWAWAPKPEGPARVLLTVVYDDGFVSGLAADREVKVASRAFKLSQLRRGGCAATREVEPAEGPPIQADIDGLDGAGLTVGNRTLHVDLNRASDVHFEAPEELAPAPGLGNLREGRFIRPFFSPTPVTAFRSVHGREGSPGGLKTEAFEEKDRVRIFSNGFNVQFFADGAVPPYVLTFSNPTSGRIEAGKSLRDPRGKVRDLGSRAVEGPGGDGPIVCGAFPLRPTGDRLLGLRPRRSHRVDPRKLVVQITAERRKIRNGKCEPVRDFDRSQARP